MWSAFIMTSDKPSKSRRIGFIGLGNMGGPMAHNLLQAGFDVVGFDLSEHNLTRLREQGGVVATSISAVAEDAEIVITMLPAGTHVRSVLSGEAGIFKAAPKGCLIIDCSTIDVSTAREMANEAEMAKHLMIDAPVSGGIMGATAGSLTFMCGGSEVAFNKAQPILDIMGANIIHAGVAGNGQAAKVCNNMLLGISMIGVSEAFNLADSLGLDRQKLFDISSSASGQCWSLNTYCPVPGPVPTSPANNDYKAGFSVAMMLKDLKLSQDAALTNHANTPLGQLATDLYDQFEKSGNSEVDFSGIIEFLRQQKP